MGFFPAAGGLGIPMVSVELFDEDITPEWAKIRKGEIVLPTQAVLRALVVAAAAFGVIQTYRQVVGDASAGVDDLIADIQFWLKSQQVERGFARQQKPRPGQKGAALPIYDGEAHEREVLRALDELESFPDDPGTVERQPYEVPYKRGRRAQSFHSWLERKYSKRSQARYMRRR